MTLFTKQLLCLLGGTFAFLTAIGAGTRVVGYKPWGVPDDRREEYDAILAKWDRQDELTAQWENKPKPIVITAKTDFDFGLHDPDQSLDHSFCVRNDGDRPLELLRVIPGCRCVTAQAPDVIAPGEQADIVVRLQNEDIDHRYHWVTIDTNDPLTKQIKFRVSEMVRTGFVIPDSVTFGVSDPLQQTDASFLVYSQRWRDLDVTDVVLDDRSPLDWHAEPVPTDAKAYADLNARSIWRVRLLTSAAKYGKFTGQVQVRLAANDGQETTSQTVQYLGRVRQPIVFVSPEIHMKDGLDIGTIVSGKTCSFHLTVRLRGDLDRPIEVLNVQPPELQASLAQTPRRGEYRLVITVDKHCPMVVFNRPQQHGYVQVGDPEDKDFRNWFPLYGAVLTLDP